MFYKLMDGEIVVDLVRKAQYVRYLPRSKRWVNTDASSANGVLNADGSKVYHLQGRTCACPDSLLQVRLVKIDEKEYQALLSQLSATRAENHSLRQEIDSLRAQLNEQNALLQQILAKL